MFKTGKCRCINRGWVQVIPYVDGEGYKGIFVTISPAKGLMECHGV